MNVDATGTQPWPTILDKIILNWTFWMYYLTLSWIPHSQTFTDKIYMYHLLDKIPLLENYHLHGSVTVMIIIIIVTFHYLLVHTVVF